MHIGIRIKEVLKNHPKGHNVKWFAKELNTSRRNVYDIFNRNDLDTNLLRRISRILDYDFFFDLSEEFSQEPASEINNMK